MRALPWNKADGKSGCTQGMLVVSLACSWAGCTLVQHLTPSRRLFHTLWCGPVWYTQQSGSIAGSRQQMSRGGYRQCTSPPLTRNAYSDHQHAEADRLRFSGCRCSMGADGGHAVI